MIKVDIISGFLGAGKTTLIKLLLAEALKGQQVVLIENEFGEIGIDGGFLKEAGIAIREMNSGCICCSLVGDFGTALTEVAKQYHPDRIIIEPSGVGKLSDVIHAVERVKDEAGIAINSATTVVDVLKCRMYLKNFGEFFRNQVESAGTVILSRTDTRFATAQKMEEALELLRPLNPDATFITTPITELGGEKVLETMEGVKVDLHHHDHDHGHEHHHDHAGHHHADDVFTSWGRETVRKYTMDEMRDILMKLTDTDEYGTVLRAKGMVPDENGAWIYFDMVPGEQDIRTGSPEYTGRLCVIGADLKEDNIAALFGV